MTSTTLERAARALCAEEHAGADQLTDIVDDKWEHHLSQARAVLMAVRELHEEEAIMYAGRDAADASGFNGSRKYGMAFSAMIDTILAEGE